MKTRNCFRAFGVDNLFHYAVEIKANGEIGYWDKKNFLSVDINNVNQASGHLDKNKSEIYEGDIVKRFDGIECFVCFDRGCFCLRVLLDPRKCCCLKEIENSHLIEVIGNIYENSDKLTPFAKSFI